MAEYIELGELQKFCKKYTEYDAIQLILNDRTDLIPTADVVERSKIDNAIEEIKAESYSEHIDDADCDDILIIELRDVLEILKRNIGE